MSYERVVELNRWPGIGFGFSVIGGSDTHIPPMICALVRDSPALLSKQVYVGDVLYKVNGVNVTTLETKQVVDLIRNCKKSIVLTLKEDRLAKLKARPFLAEDTLIEPPRAGPQHHYRQQQQQQTRGANHNNHNDPRRVHHHQQQHHHNQRKQPDNQSRSAHHHHPPPPSSSSYNHEAHVNVRTRTIVSPKSYEYGTDGRYQNRDSHRTPNHIDLSSTYSYYHQSANPQSVSSSGRHTGVSHQQSGIGNGTKQSVVGGGIRQPVNSGTHFSGHPVRSHYQQHSGDSTGSHGNSKDIRRGTFAPMMDSKSSKAGGGGGDKQRHNTSAPHSRQSSPPNATVTAHVYTLEDVPLSPRYYEKNINHHTTDPSEVSYQSLANKRQGEEYVPLRIGNNDYANVSNSYSETSIPLASNRHHHQQQQQRPPNNYRQKMGKKYGSFDRLDYTNSSSPEYQQHHRKSQLSAPHYKTEGQFDFNDGAVQSCIEQPHDFTSSCIKLQNNNVTNSNHVTGNHSNKNRPHSNPEILESDSTMKDPDNVYAGTGTPAIISKSHQQNSNYSSPNIFNGSERMHSEHKGITLTPATHSVYALSKPEEPTTPPSNGYDKEESLLSPLSITTTPQSTSNSAMSSSAVSPMSFLTESELSGSMSSNQITKEEVSPADIASRLFTLNGYKDTDVAPLLGKNSDFSQQICKEYLRFFQFEGITLDEAIRQFLGKFPLTGETQERERILIHFSNRFHECNQITEMDQDSVHTLVCALMLLNTDLHGQSISNKMTLNDFVTNLSGLCSGKDFPKEYLKTLYNSVKTKEIVFARAETNDINASPKVRRKNSAPGNPFIELKVDSNDAVVYEGLIYRKSVMDPGGRRTPLMRRNWRPFYCVLRGLVMLNYKPDNLTTLEPQSIGIHHALAGYAKDYKKRMFVFKLITADWSVYYIQVKNQEEVKTWMDAVNVSAAILSSPPLPAPCGSSVRFQRPVMPISRTRLTPEKQLEHHTEKVATLEKDLLQHIEDRPTPSNKYYQDWENKNDYLEFEMKRFKAYVSVLTLPKLKPFRDKIVVNSDAHDDPKKKKNATAPNGKLKPPPSTFEIPRSSSMHSLSTILNTDEQRDTHNENRLSYAVGPP